VRLLLLFGGASFEHEISIISAITVMNKSTLFEFIPIFCRDDHRFFLIDSANMKAKFFKNFSQKSSTELHLTNGGFVKRSFFKKEMLTGTVLNLIHGADGEDGTIASLLEFYKIAYIGPNPEACHFSFNKLYTKAYADLIGVKRLPFEVLHKTDARQITMALPYIIKPVRLGSSIGISVVKEKQALEYALDVAFEFDDTVIIEPYVEGIKEYNLAGSLVNHAMEFSIIEEPKKEQILDFDQKYLDFSREKRIEAASIDALLQEALKEAFTKVYGTLFQGAIVRCDFFVHDNSVLLNEINPIPGSMAAYLFEEFDTLLRAVADSVRAKESIAVSYDYIDKIHLAKGK